MLYDYSKLKGRITELYSSQRNYARHIGISEKTLSKKLKHGLTIKDVEEWSTQENLNIKPVEYPDFYFKRKENRIACKTDYLQLNR